MFARALPSLIRDLLDLALELVTLGEYGLRPATEGRAGAASALGARPRARAGRVLEGPPARPVPDCRSARSSTTEPAQRRGPEAAPAMRYGGVVHAGRRPRPKAATVAGRRRGGRRGSGAQRAT